MLPTNLCKESFTIDVEKEEVQFPELLTGYVLSSSSFSPGTFSTRSVSTSKLSLTTSRLSFSSESLTASPK